MKKTNVLKKLLLVLLVITVAMSFCACSAPAVSNPDGSDTLAGMAAKTVLEIVAAAAVTVISLCGAWITKQFGEKTKFINTQRAFAIVIEMAKQTVEELKQTTVDKLKAESPDGKLTSDQIDALKKMLLGLTMKKLDDPTKNLLAAVGADICAVITGAGESWICSMKNDPFTALEPVMVGNGILEENAEKIRQAAADLHQINEGCSVMNPPSGGSAAQDD